MRSVSSRLAAVVLLFAAGLSVHASSGQSTPPPAPTKAEEAKSPPAPNPQGDEIRLNRELITVNVTVMDSYGRFVTGLDKKNFEVYDEKVKQDIAFFSDEDAPVTLGIVYDVSGSMESRIKRSLYALHRFVETSQPEDEFFL